MSTTHFSMVTVNTNFELDSKKGSLQLTNPNGGFQIEGM